MKKVQTLALALALIGLGSVSRTATSISASRSMQKNPPETNATNLNSSRSNIYRVKVTMVTEKDRTFAVEVNFSVKKAAPLPKKEEQVDVTYTESTSGEPPEATTVKSSKSTYGVAKATHGETRNEVLGSGASSERLTAGQYRMTGKVTQVNEKDKTLTVEVTLSAKTLLTLPEVGKIYDITFTQTTPGGPLEAVKLNSSKSNIY